jgi:DNA polymerase V
MERIEILGLATAGAAEFGAAMQVVAINPARRGIPVLVPMVGAGVRAGFPSPADDYLEARIDLNDQLIKHPAATFLVKARGESMESAGIRDGATLVVDRSLEARDGDVVIAIVDGNLTVKLLKMGKSGSWLEASCPDARYKPIPLATDDMIWGVVTNAINPMGQRR